MTKRSSLKNIYVIACLGPSAVKIGITAGHPIKRLRQLQTGCPSRLMLVGWFPGKEDDETALHERLKPFRMRGEWFALTDELGEEMKQEIELMTLNRAATNHDMWAGVR